MKEKKSSLLYVVFILLVTLQACTNAGNEMPAVKRFEKDLFDIKDFTEKYNIDSLKGEYPLFFPLFCTDIIRVGPDTTESSLKQLGQFINDPLIKQVREMTDSVYPDFNPYAKIIQRGISNFGEKTGTHESIEIITYISGFNQSFVALPGSLAIGLDNYLGGDTGFYRQLALPKYLRQTMDPEFIATDAVRAWIISELSEPDVISTLLDNMVYEGMVLFYLKNSLPRMEEHKIFRYTREQLEWCEQYERSMWNYLLENELLFSTDRMIISRMTKEGPFVREFSQDSPGRAGAWIGYRIFENYMKRNAGNSLWPTEILDSREVLSKSRYRP